MAQSHGIPRRGGALIVCVPQPQGDLFGLRTHPGSLPCDY
jgi:hypothetical protein